MSVRLPTVAIIFVAIFVLAFAMALSLRRNTQTDLAFSDEAERLEAAPANAGEAAGIAPDTARSHEER